MTRLGAFGWRKSLEPPHTVQCQPQFQAYLNRFGAGMVIYWFGLVEGLGVGDDDVLLLGDFPPPEAIFKLKTLPARGAPPGESPGGASEAPPRGEL